MARLLDKCTTTVLTICLVVSFAQAADLTSGLVAYWQFNGNVKDAIGGYDGVLMQEAKIINDPKRGQVLDLTGSEGDAHMELEHAPNIGFVDDMTLTISVWVKPAELPRTGWTTVLAKNREVHYNNAYGIWINPSNFWHFRIDGKAGDGNVAATEGWHHLTMRHDASNNAMHGFVDGIQVYENTGAPSHQFAESALWVGQANGVDEPYPGLIDDLAIYNRALADAEIVALANGGKISFQGVEPAGKLTTT